MPAYNAGNNRSKTITTDIFIIITLYILGFTLAYRGIRKDYNKGGLFYGQMPTGLDIIVCFVPILNLGIGLVLWINSFNFFRIKK